MKWALCYNSGLSDPIPYTMGEGRDEKGEGIKMVNGISFCMFTQKTKSNYKAGPKPIEFCEKNTDPLLQNSS